MLWIYRFISSPTGNEEEVFVNQKFLAAGVKVVTFDASFKITNMRRKDLKVKKHFQPCLAEQKAHGGSRNQSYYRGNFPTTP